MKTSVFTNCIKSSYLWAFMHELMVPIALYHLWLANKHKKIERKNSWIFRFLTSKYCFSKKTHVFWHLFPEFGLQFLFRFFCSDLAWTLCTLRHLYDVSQAPQKNYLSIWIWLWDKREFVSSTYRGISTKMSINVHFLCFWQTCFSWKAKCDSYRTLSGCRTV